MLHRGQLRPSTLAGTWYPADPDTLETSVRRYLAAGARPPMAVAPAAIVSPHAGYVYSGPIAGVAWAAAAGVSPGRVVIVGPAHRVGFDGISAGDFSAYRCPLGDLPVDRSLIAELEHRGLLSVAPAAHEREHCVEIMLPFVAVCFGAETPIVPLLVGRAGELQVVDVLDRCVRVGDLLVVSTDLSHFLPYAAACARDRATLAGVARGETAHLDGESACGHRGLAAALALARRRRWRVQLLDYRNSGDTAGDRGRVVGYGAAALVPS